MPEVGGGENAVYEHAGRSVFAGFPLVAHDGHLGFEILRGDERVDHAIRFQIQRPIQVIDAGRERLVVVRAVEPRGAVGEGTVFGEFVVDIRVIGGALENQMLEQVGHARFAIALVPGAHHVGDVHGDLLLASVRKQQEAQAVRQPILGNPLHRRHLHRIGRRGFAGGRFILRGSLDRRAGA